MPSMSSMICRCEIDYSIRHAATSTSSTAVANTRITVTTADAHRLSSRPAAPLSIGVVVDGPPPARWVWLRSAAPAVAV